jgi:hypothetical protein
MKMAIFSYSKKIENRKTYECGSEKAIQQIPSNSLFRNKHKHFVIIAIVILSFSTGCHHLDYELKKAAMLKDQGNIESCRDHIEKAFSDLGNFDTRYGKRETALVSFAGSVLRMNLPETLTMEFMERSLRYADENLSGFSLSGIDELSSLFTDSPLALLSKIKLINNALVLLSKSTFEEKKTTGDHVTEMLSLFLKPPSISEKHGKIVKASPLKGKIIPITESSKKLDSIYSLFPENLRINDPNEIEFIASIKRIDIKVNTYFDKKEKVADGYIISYEIKIINAQTGLILNDITFKGNEPPSSIVYLKDKSGKSYASDVYGTDPVTDTIAYFLKLRE